MFCANRAKKKIYEKNKNKIEIIKFSHIANCMCTISFAILFICVHRILFIYCFMRLCILFATENSFVVNYTTCFFNRNNLRSTIFVKCIYDLFNLCLCLCAFKSIPILFTCYWCANVYVSVCKQLCNQILQHVYCY